jgi:hypothetical protein
MPVGPRHDRTRRRARRASRNDPQLGRRRHDAMPTCPASALRTAVPRGAPSDRSPSCSGLRHRRLRGVGAPSWVRRRHVCRFAGGHAVGLTPRHGRPDREHGSARTGDHGLSLGARVASHQLPTRTRNPVEPERVDVSALPSGEGPTPVALQRVRGGGEGILLPRRLRGRPRTWPPHGPRCPLPR